MDSNQPEQAKAYEPKREYFVRVATGVLLKIFSHGTSVSYTVKSGFPSDLTVVNVVIDPSKNLIDFIFTSELLDGWIDAHPEEAPIVEAPSPLILPGGSSVEPLKLHLVGKHEWNVNVIALPWQTERKMQRRKIREKEKAARKVAQKRTKS